MGSSTTYDAVIVGAGHNGLNASCYLAMAGLRVLILEKNETVGGATCSEKILPGVDARLSVYSYLVSLLPKKILTDLGIDFETRQRKIASYTPSVMGSHNKGLLISNISDEATRRSFSEFTGGESEYGRYRILQAKLKLFAQKIWPTLVLPLPSSKALKDKFKTEEEKSIWEYLVEKPLCSLIEDHLSDDTVRGVVFTDAKIGVSTFPDDPSLLQNKTFLYHIIGQGSGEWNVPDYFHGNLTWPFAEREEEAGTWGVETNYENVFICGSSAKRGGAVSGIPGHNAAMKVLEVLATSSVRRR
jgi:phytoene dehydrogenase-like protein